MTERGEAGAQALLCATNHLSVYPEHRDHDETDLFPANWPYMIVSQGFSGSDRPFLEAAAMTLAAFPPETSMVYYWFQQRERRIASDISAKFWLMIDGITTGRTDGALVRLTTPIRHDETDAEAEARLFEVLQSLGEPLPRFIPAS